jgi:hypothetical protein
MTDMADKIAAVKAGKPSMAALVAMAALIGAPPPEQKADDAPQAETVKDDGHSSRPSNGFYNRSQWAAMRKRRKQAKAAKRRNRR